MTSETFVLLSGTLTFGVPLAIALCELMTLRQAPRGGDEPPPQPWPPRSPKPLPECLLPKPIGIRNPILIQVLEDA